MSELDKFISRLYRSTQDVNIEHFREWAIKELQALIHFDAAIWSTGHFSTRTFHTHTTLNLPKTFSDSLLANLSINPISRNLFNQVGKPIDMSDVISDELFYESEIYNLVFRPNKIERILSSIDIAPRSGIYTLLSIYRNDRSSKFTSTEKQVYQKALFHLKEAASHACLLSLKDKDDDNIAHYAICDIYGVYHEVEPMFIDMLDDCLPNIETQKLPPELLVVNQKKQLGDLVIQSKSLGDLFRVSIRQVKPFDNLTQREQEVVTGVTQGLSFKQIAKKLDRSPSTISNHLYRIYQKLNIHNRSELADLIKQS